MARIGLIFAVFLGTCLLLQIDARPKPRRPHFSRVGQGSSTTARSVSSTHSPQSSTDSSSEELTTDFVFPESSTENPLPEASTDFESPAESSTDESFPEVSTEDSSFPEEFSTDGSFPGDVSTDQPEPESASTDSSFPEVSTEDSIPDEWSTELPVEVTTEENSAIHNRDHEEQPAHAVVMGIQIIDTDPTSQVAHSQHAPAPAPAEYKSSDQFVRKMIRGIPLQ